MAKRSKLTLKTKKRLWNENRNNPEIISYLRGEAQYRNQVAKKSAKK